jgi:hypothetical protein
MSECEHEVVKHCVWVLDYSDGNNEVHAIHMEGHPPAAVIEGWLEEEGFKLDSISWMVSQDFEDDVTSWLIEADSPPKWLS